MTRGQIWHARWRLARTVQRRDLHATLHSFGLYVTLSTAIAVAATVLRNQMATVQEVGLSALSNPFALSLFGAVVLSSAYLAVTSTLTIARERDRGTLETLFYGPVDAEAYLWGKYLSQMGAYVLMAAVYLAALAAYALVTNFAFTPKLIWAALLSIATASAVVAVGILLSTLNRSARGALLALLAVVILFLAVQLGHDLVAGLMGGLPRNCTHPLFTLQTLLARLDAAANWLSPFAHLERGIDAILRGSVGEVLLMAGLSLAYTVLALSLAARTLRRKGVRG
jgi:ABC-type transport system involved in multi-copper enzyme maturation permease subunit